MLKQQRKPRPLPRPKAVKTENILACFISNEARRVFSFFIAGNEAREDVFRLNRLRPGKRSRLTLLLEHISGPEITVVLLIHRPVLKVRQ